MKLNHFKLGSIGFLILASLGIQACSHVEVDKIPSNADPNDEISRLELDQKDAYDRQLNVLAPTYYKKSKEALQAAKEKRNQEKGNESILEKVGEGRAYLRKCDEVGRVSDLILKDVLQARAKALAAQAPVFAPKELNEVDRTLVDVALRLENKDTESAEKQKYSLKQKYLNVELAAIKQSYLEPPRRLIRQAIQEGAETKAPTTLQEAQASLDQLDSWITLDRYNHAEFQRRSKESMASAERLLRITRTAKNMKRADAEAVILEQETRNLGEVKLNQAFDFAKQQFNTNEADVFRENNRIIISLKGFHFQSGTAVIPKKGYPILEIVQQVVRQCEDPQIIIEGHTDASGSGAFNRELSLKRAQAVRHYFLANHLIPDSRIVAVGQGNDRPIASNKSAFGRAQNRRVNIIIENNSTP